MKTEHAEACVIGAGLGGLAAAAYLARAGKRVTVLEHHAVPGGYAHEFRRGAYRFEVALHALDGVGPGGWTRAILEDLNVLKQVEFKRLDPWYTAFFPAHQVCAHLDPDRFEADLARQFPSEASGLRFLCADMKLAFRQGHRSITETQIAGMDPGHVLGRSPELADALGLTWSAYLARFVRDPRLKGMLSALWGYLGVPPSELNATAYIFAWGSYHLTGAYYPAGGSMALSRAIEKTIVSHGGKVMYRQTVNRIEIREGLAVAAETSQGLRLEAGMFISNANPKDTLLKFTGPAHLPASYARKLGADRPSLSSFVVYLGLNRALAAADWPHHEVILFETYDADEDYAFALAGNWSKVSLTITHYNHADPGCSPKDGSVVALLALTSWDYADQWGTGGDLTDYRKNPRYVALKNAAAQILIERAAARIPELRESIRYCEVATPLTNYRYTRNSMGAIYGSAASVSSNTVERWRHETAIPNLLLAGAWASNGGMSAALVSGASAAMKAGTLLAGGQMVPTLVPPEDPYASLSGMSDNDIAALLEQELMGAHS